MKIKKNFIEKFIKKNKKQRKKNIVYSNAQLYMNDEKVSFLLGSAKDLSTATHLRGYGVWSEEDFTLLKQSLKAGLSKMSANISLHEIDLGEVILSNEDPEISFKELFSYCVNLTKVTLPDASRYEGSTNFHSTFKGCCKLKELNNLETYRNISDLRGSFYYCNLLNKINILTSPLPKSSEDTFQKISPDIQVTIPKGLVIPNTWIQIKPKNVAYLE